MLGRAEHCWAESSVVLSLVEHSWRDARNCSLDLAEHGVTVVHIVKGKLDRSVRDIIRPMPNIRMVVVARSLFWLVVGWHGLCCLVRGRLRGVLVDNERSYKRLHVLGKLAGIPPMLLKHSQNGYELWVGEKRVIYADWQRAVSS